MSFNYTNVKARLEDSRRRGALRSPGGAPPTVLGGPGGEVGGSVGCVLGFSTPGGSRVDSEEEMFAERESSDQPFSAEKQEKGAVKLVLPLLVGQLGMENEWIWKICGGLIGGARGSRFCTKPINDPRHAHCSVVSHTVHKAPSEEGHGHIPNVLDRGNTELAFLEPSVDPARYPGVFTELLGQSLSREEWIASITILPTVREMEESTKIGHEMVAEVMEKARYVVSFAVTPAAKRAAETYKCCVQGTGRGSSKSRGHI
jgi:hypothetical protein